MYIHVPRLLDKNTCKKLQQVFMGPYIVCKFHSNCSVILQNLTTNKIVARAVHVDRLKKVQSVRNNKFMGRLIQARDDIPNKQWTRREDTWTPKKSLMAARTSLIQLSSINNRQVYADKRPNAHYILKFIGPTRQARCNMRRPYKS